MIFFLILSPIYIPIEEVRSTDYMWDEIYSYVYGFRIEIESPMLDRKKCVRIVPKM